MAISLYAPPPPPVAEPPPPPPPIVSIVLFVLFQLLGATHEELPDKKYCVGVEDEIVWGPAAAANVAVIFVDCPTAMLGSSAEIVTLGGAGGVTVSVPPLQVAVPPSPETVPV